RLAGRPVGTLSWWSLTAPNFGHRPLGYCESAGKSKTCRASEWQSHCVGSTIGDTNVIDVEKMTKLTRSGRMRKTQTAFTDAGEGPAVLLLHGYPFDRSMWQGQIDVLKASGFSAIAPDLRGLGATAGKLQSVPQDTRGQTESYRTINTMDEMARDAAALLDQLHVGEVVVCGLSMGGYVAFEFLKLFPSRVHALVLAGTR